MFVIFRNDFEDRLININQINAIWKEKASEQPSFRIEYFGGGFRFDSIEWNHFSRRIGTLDDVWNTLNLFKKLDKLNKEVER